MRSDTGLSADASFILSQVRWQDLAGYSLFDIDQDSASPSIRVRPSPSIRS